MDFKNRALDFVSKESEILENECLKSDNSHLILLNQTALVDTIVQAAFCSALWFFNKQNRKELTPEPVPIALLGCGGYGREEKYFRSNVDGQIISQETIDDE